MSSEPIHIELALLQAYMCQRKAEGAVPIMAWGRLYGQETSEICKRWLLENAPLKDEKGLMSYYYSWLARFKEGRTNKAVPEQVADLVWYGFTDREIMEILSISRTRVRVCRKRWEQRRKRRGA